MPKEKKIAFSLQLEPENYKKIAKIAEEQKRSFAFVINAILSKCDL